MRGAEPGETGQPPAVRSSFPWRNARAHRVREAERDQGQPIEIPEFRVQKTGDNRKDQADRQLFPTSAGLRDQRGQHVGSWYVPLKGRSMGTRQDSKAPANRATGMGGLPSFAGAQANGEVVPEEGLPSPKT